MRSLLGRLTASETPELIDKNGHLMATKIRTVQKNRKKMVTEELKAVIAERDTAVEKVNTAFLLAFFLACMQAIVNSQVAQAFLHMQESLIQAKVL